MTEWRPISEAPKDGTLLLLCCVGWPPARLRGEPWPMKVGGWHETGWYIFGASWAPTHFMTLPQPPTEEDVHD